MAESCGGGFNRPKYLACHLGLLVNLWAFSTPATAELLGRISDETAPAASPAESATAKHNDRKIIYRVICSPEDKDLPDCDKSAVDDGSDAGQAVALPMPDLPPDSEDASGKPEPAEPAKRAATEKPKKSPRKKAPAQKKSVKKAAAKKPVGKKRSRN